MNQPRPNPENTGRIMVVVLVIIAGFLLTRCLASCTAPDATVEVRDGKRVTRVKIPQHALINFTISAAGGLP